MEKEVSSTNYYSLDVNKYEEDPNISLEVLAKLSLYVNAEVNNSYKAEPNIIKLSGRIMISF